MNNDSQGYDVRCNAKMTKMIVITNCGVGSLTIRRCHSEEAGWVEKIAVFW